MKIKQRAFKKRILKIKKIKTYAYAKKKQKEKARTKYLKRKKNPRGIKNIPNFSTSKSTQYNKNFRKLRLRDWIGTYTKIFTLYSYHFLFKFFKKKKKNNLKIATKTSKYFILPGLKPVSSYNWELWVFLLSRSTTTQKKFEVYTSVFWKRLIGTQIKKSKKIYITKQIKKALFIASKKLNIPVFYLVYFFEYWFKLPIYLKWFAIYNRQIQIPIAIHKNSKEKSILIVTNWLRESFKERPEKKLHLRIAGEIISLFLKKKK